MHYKAYQYSVKIPPSRWFWRDLITVIFPEGEPTKRELHYVAEYFCSIGGKPRWSVTFESVFALIFRVIILIAGLGLIYKIFSA